MGTARGNAQNKELLKRLATQKILFLTSSRPWLMFVAHSNQAQKHYERRKTTSVTKRKEEILPRTNWNVENPKKEMCRLVETTHCHAADDLFPVYKTNIIFFQCLMCCASTLLDPMPMPFCICVGRFIFCIYISGRFGSLKIPSFFVCGTSTSWSS